PRTGGGVVKSGASAVVDPDDALDFVLPPALEATAPAEAVGAGRDDVRLLVAYRRTGELVDTMFDPLPDFLRAHDLLWINTSGTLPAALDAQLADGTPVVVHLSTQLGGDMWVIELRDDGGASPWRGNVPDGSLRTADGGRIALHGPFMGSPR